MKDFLKKIKEAIKKGVAYVGNALKNIRPEDLLAFKPAMEELVKLGGKQPSNDMLTLLNQSNAVIKESQLAFHYEPEVKIWDEVQGDDVRVSKQSAVAIMTVISTVITFLMKLAEMHRRNELQGSSLEKLGRLSAKAEDTVEEVAKDYASQRIADFIAQNLIFIILGVVAILYLFSRK